MKFSVYRTKTFDKEFDKLPVAEQREIEKFEKKLADSPFIGKPLGFVFFREKRLNNRRVYFLIYGDLVIVLMAAISDKKTQQATIDMIKSNLDKFYEYVKKELRKHV